MQNFSWSFLLLHISTALVFILFILIFRMKNKKEIHTFSLALVFSVFVWSAAMLAEIYAKDYFNYTGMLFTNIYFTAVGFVPVCVFLMGFVFAYSGTALKKTYYLLFLIPVLTLIMIWTNSYHHLFFINYSLNSNEIVQGPYLIFETLFSYAFNLIGLYFLIFFSIKNSGFFSKQSILIFVGALIPLLVDMAFVLDVFSFPLYFEPISFAVGVFCFMLAIFRFGFLNIVPIALQTVVDHISDSYIVLNENSEVIDYNKALLDNFEGASSIKRKDNIKDWLSQIDTLTNASSSIFISSLNEAVENKKSVYFDKQLTWENFDKTFTVEMTPVFSAGRHKGTIILLKDITEQKKSFELIRLTQTRLIESEHLASLGQLVGGIAHNLKSPIMSISGGLEGLNDLIEEYDESIEDNNVTKEDHHEISKEMRQWTNKMKIHCSYMSDIISTVKGQAVQLTTSTTDKFILKELMKRIEILMNHELKRYCCKLNVKCLVDENIEIKGEVNSLVQVFNNLIINSIEAYEGKAGQIDFLITECDDDMVKFEIRDYGCGIPQDVKNRLFKEMITTKGLHGTGLGLYMSHSTIWGRFGGKMWFESEEGKGTVFYITVPSVTRHLDVEGAV